MHPYVKVNFRGFLNFMKSIFSCNSMYINDIDLLYHRCYSGIFVIMSSRRLTFTRITILKIFVTCCKQSLFSISEKVVVLPLSQKACSMVHFQNYHCRLKITQSRDIKDTMNENPIPVLTSPCVSARVLQGVSVDQRHLHKTNLTIKEYI